MVPKVNRPTSRREAASNPVYTQLMGATKRLLGNKIALVPLFSLRNEMLGRGDSNDEKLSQKKTVLGTCYTADTEVTQRNPDWDTTCTRGGLAKDSS
jgi:hypothetical protein